MPNHIQNRLMLFEDNGLAEDILASLIGDEVEFDFSKIIEKPKELINRNSSRENDNEILVELYGADNGCDWSTMEWGTKWNAYDVISMDKKGVSFKTAWSSPIPVITELSKQNPKVVFLLEYADEDIGYNCGVKHFLNGEVIVSKDMSIGNLKNKEESIRWALIMRYGSDENYEEDYENNKWDI